MPSRKYFDSNEEYNAVMLSYYHKNKERILKNKRKRESGKGYAYQRNWQLTHPERERARGAVRRARARGIIVKQPCITCGDENSVAHHPDYSKPLEIVWYCRSHHRAEHYGNSLDTNTKAEKNANNPS